MCNFTYLQIRNTVFILKSSKIYPLIACFKHGARTSLNTNKEGDDFYKMRICVYNNNMQKGQTRTRVNVTLDTNLYRDYKHASERFKKKFGFDVPLSGFIDQGMVRFVVFMEEFVKNVPQGWTSEQILDYFMERMKKKK